MRGNLVVMFCWMVLIGAFVPSNAAFAQQAAPAPTKVVVGAYVNDLQNVDLASHSYIVDLYIWFRWSNRDIDVPATMEFMNIFPAQERVQKLTYDKPLEMPDGTIYNVIRYQGAFSSKFLLESYPFDTQLLVVAIEDAELGAEDLVYVPDAEGITINPDVRLPGYRIGKPEMRFSAKPYPTTFGDLSSPETSAYSRVSLVIPITRPWISGLVKTLIPIFIAILCAGLALYIHPDHVEGRIGLVITALLTLVALQFTAAADLPTVGYLMLIDQIYLVSFIYMLAVLARVVSASWIDSDVSHDVVARRDRRAHIATTVLFSGVLAAMIVAGVNG